MKKALVVDIGGTKLHAAIMNENGQIELDKKIRTKTDKGRDGLLSSLYEIIDSLISIEDVDAIGIASAGRVNFDDGSIYYATDNLPNWTGTKLKELVSKRYNKEVIVENDVNAAGIGEYWMGNSMNTSSSVCITLGTGIAGAIILNNKIVRGAHWSAGELGHMIIHPNGRQCNCGLKGCFEQYCSGTSLVKSFNNISEEKINTGYDFFNLVEYKDKTAMKILDEFTSDLSLAIDMLSNSFDPEIFIIGGGLINTKEFWWDDFINKSRSSPINNVFSPKIIQTKFENLSGLYGMAYLTLINSNI